MATRKLRAALAACGGIAPLTLDAASRSPDFELVAIQDPDEGARASVGERYGISRRHAEFAELLTADVDFVVVNSPNHLHREQTVAAVRAGKHVLVQKPMAEGLAAAREMAAAAEAAGVRLGVTMFELGKPLHHEVKAMVGAGWFGEPTLVQAVGAHTIYLAAPPPGDNWRRDAGKVGGGAFIQLAVHSVNLACWLLSRRVTEVTAVTTAGRTVFADETTVASMLLEGGLAAQFAASYAADLYSFTLCGTRGRVSLSPDHVLLRGEEPWQGEILSYAEPGREVAVPMDSLADATEAARDRVEVHGAFARWVRDGGEYVGAAERGLRDMEVVAAVYRSLEEATCVALSSTVMLLALVALPFLPGARCRATPPEREVTLLVPVYFYQGHTVGKGNRTTGLQVSTDGGESFSCVTWPELITNSVAVDESGRHVYLACGNGVMISSDGAQTWRLTGGFTMAEVQKVALDRRDPGHAWAATAYGLFEKQPGSLDWTPADSRGLFRHMTEVVQDSLEPDRLFLGTSRGLFVSRDGGRTFLATPVSGLPVRRVMQDRNDPKRFFAATDGRGLMCSTDGGETWARVKGPPETVFCVVPDTRTEGKTLFCGTRDGLCTSGDGGKTWSTTTRGIPEGSSVYGIAVDPTHEGRLIVSGNDGLFAREKPGAPFTRLGLESALVPDLVWASLAQVVAAGPPTEPGKLPLAAAPELEEYRPEADPAFDSRREELLDHYRGLPPPAEGRWMGWQRAALHVADGKADETFWKDVLAQLAEPQRSMFFSMPLMGFFLHARDEMPAEVVDRIREVMTTNAVYRGDTENHWVMHYAALLLAAQSFPEASAAVWYTGRSTAEVYDEAKGWLLHWARLTAAKGQGEFDSPNYFFMYVSPLLLLYDFAEEPRVRMAAGMMLDLLLADYLVESLSGAWCGGHSRIIGSEVERTTGNRVSVLHFLYAGGIARPEKPHGWMILAALSSYRPPAQFPEVANQRETYLHFERKRVRNVIRYGEKLNPPVFKTTLMTKGYGLGSLQGGILQPIQQHTWDVTWLGSAENSTLFTVHPSISARELAMFFPEEVRAITRTITNQKGVYGSPDKLVSASPWERVGQKDNVLLAHYRVPEGERFPHVDLYWPDCLALTEERGWLFGRDGEFWVGVRPTKKGEWSQGEGFRRYRCPADGTGFVVVTRHFGEWALRGTYDAFKKEMAAGPAPAFEDEGRTFQYGDLRLVWDEPWVPHPNALFEGPFLYSKAGSRVIRLQASGLPTRTLDFNKFEIRED